MKAFFEVNCEFSEFLKNFILLLMYFFLWILFWYLLTFSEGYDVNEPFLHGTAVRSVATDKREEFYRWELDVTFFRL